MTFHDANVNLIPFLFQCITAFGVVVGIVVSLRNRNKLTHLEINIDGRMADLLRIAQEASAAEGNKTGRAEQMLEVAKAKALVVEQAADLGLPGERGPIEVTGTVVTVLPIDLDG